MRRIVIEEEFRLEILIDFPVVLEASIAWGEMDAYQHVNNVVYFRYFENVQIACFEQLRMMEHKEQSGIGPILASTQCRFKIPLTYPYTISIGSKIEELEEDRFIMKDLVVSHRLQKVAAEGEGLVVFSIIKKTEGLPSQRVETTDSQYGMSRAHLL